MFEVATLFLDSQLLVNKQYLPVTVNIYNENYEYIFICIVNIILLLITGYLDICDEFLSKQNKFKPAT